MSRPDKLTPLFRSLRSFKGVGPQVSVALKRLLGTPEGQDPVALDLLLHTPFAFIDRSEVTDLARVPLDAVVTCRVHVDRHHAPPKTKRVIPHRVDCHDETGELTLVFFGNKGGWVERALPVGEVRLVSGRVTYFQGIRQMSHPDLIATEQEYEKLPPFEPVYPLTAGLSRRVLARLASQVLESLPRFAEWVPADRLVQQKWPDFATALREVHHPQDAATAQLDSSARRRLAYDEYLAGQVTLQLVRSRTVTRRGRARRMDGRLTTDLKNALPFTLTAAQRAAIGEIMADLKAPERMSRLLQGDVGAGKTVVALMAMAAVAEDGAQSAFMAPTELLAQQHFGTIAPLCEAIGLTCRLLTGKMRGAEARQVLSELQDGTCQIVVGTHALFQGDVGFADLGLVVVDEQHRFGVHQRLALSDKGEHSDLLVMTATPIPRTLVLTHFGDMAVSQIRGKPAGRQPIETAVLSIDALDRVVDRLAQRIVSGAQAYWVCPLVEESEEVDLVSAQDRFDFLRTRFGDRVGLIHGRMTSGEKQAVMEAFSSGRLAVLVATTVIEVGVDVPNATIMIVEHSERFGLAQLHQLRGRVGRGTEKSACLLLFKGPLGPTAQARLDTIKSTEDGFVIAEMDLELRGHGDVLGTRQSGMPDYHLVIPDLHREMLELAHADAQRILETNPGLAGEDGNAVRELLYVFRRDLAIPLIRSG
ncbi:MAG: ATP-dependent DNA helicase RecG [Hyphomicrobiaceae bacterium]|nr:ATP-dependent DNA helicase RecG [Hyphomicrobiaceae bacterium]